MSNKKCTCGGDSVGGAHSDWCDAVIVGPVQMTDEDEKRIQLTMDESVLYYIDDED